MFRAETGRRLEILTLHVEDDDRAGPAQQIGDDDADAFARPGRCLHDAMLIALKDQIAAGLLAQHNTLIAAEAMTADFAFPGKTCCAMQRRLAGDEPGEEQAGQQ